MKEKSHAYWLGRLAWGTGIGLKPFTALVVLKLLKLLIV